MKSLRRIAVAVMVGALASSAVADAPMIFCSGWRCGDPGPRSYSYHVDAVSYPMMEFRVGTNDVYTPNYHNVLIPPGWNFAVEEEPMSHCCDTCGDHTPHGQISPGPCYCLTLGSVHWWTDNPDEAVEVFTFGFDHFWPPEDVGWELTCYRENPEPEFYYFEPFWDAPLGVDHGPLHGPCWSDEYCWLNSHCGSDGYCFFHDCDLESGWCLPLPLACPETWDPVCGCDEETYANACEAARSGMSVDYVGKCEGFCPEDVNDTGQVNIDDLFQVLSAWGVCVNCVEDINQDGVVDIDDVFAVLAAWGPCL